MSLLSQKTDGIFPINFEKYSKNSELQAKTSKVSTRFLWNISESFWPKLSICLYNFE